MTGRQSFGALLLILLLLPTPALCTICTAEGCEMEKAAEDCPMMETAPDDCCAEMPGVGAGMPMGHDAPTDPGLPAGHDCEGSSRNGPPATAAADDCCATAAGREAETIAPATPAPSGGAPVLQPTFCVVPDPASNADGVRQAMPLPAAPRALFTLHSSLLI